MNGQGPSYLSERFNVLNVDYDLRGGSSRLKLPPFNLECLHKSFSYICASLWNGIPVKVREANDLLSCAPYGPKWANRSLWLDKCLQCICIDR